MNNIKYLLVLAAAMILSFSCKKDKDEESTLLSLSGELTFDYPSYARPEDSFTFIPSKVTSADGTNVGYYWRVSGVTQSDTTKFIDDVDPSNDGRWSYTMPDSLATYSVICTAYAEGHYVKSYTALITVISGESLSGRGFTDEDEIFEDSRDGRSYRYATIGGVDWMRENLAYSGSGESYMDCDVMDDVVGRYYSHEEAVKACPDGWRLPSESEWASLAASVSADGTFEPYADFKDVAGSLMADVSVNGVTLWTYWPQVKITNSSKLAVVPSGYATRGETAGNSFAAYADFAAIWSSDLDAGGDAYYRYINEGSPLVYSGHAPREGFLISVRCVR